MPDQPDILARAEAVLDGKATPSASLCAGLVAEVKRLRDSGPWVEHVERRRAMQRERDGECICDGNPATTDGPQEDCPWHGRPYRYWVDGLEHANAEVERLRDVGGHWKALWRQNIETAADAMRERDAAVAEVERLRTESFLIREARVDYDCALLRREHGAVAADRFIRAVTGALGQTVPTQSIEEGRPTVSDTPQEVIAGTIRGLSGTNSSRETLLAYADVVLVDLRARGYELVKLPEPDRFAPSTDDENGYKEWHYPRGGYVAVYDDRAIHWDGRSGNVGDLREAAGALLAAAAAVKAEEGSDA